MTTEPLSLPAARHAVHRRTYVLGSLGMLGSPMLFLEGIRFGFGPADMDFWSGLGGLLYVLGWMSSLVGLRLLRASGTGAAARLLFYVQMTGLTMAAYWTTLFTLPLPVNRETLLYQVTDLAWPVSHLLMLVLGLAVLFQRRLRGWRRLPALLVGLALPTFMVLQLLGAPPLLAGLSFPLLTMSGFFLLGLAVRTGYAQASP